MPWPQAAISHHVAKHMWRLQAGGRGQALFLPGKDSFVIHPTEQLVSLSHGFSGWCTLLYGPKASLSPTAHIFISAQGLFPLESRDREDPKKQRKELDLASGASNRDRRGWGGRVVFVIYTSSMT